jgi:hypothetical protein
LLNSYNKTANGEPLRSFNSLENAGLPHQGKVSAEEARLVRQNLEAVNANRKTQELVPIDPLTLWTRSGMDLRAAKDQHDALSAARESSLDLLVICL